MLIKLQVNGCNNQLFSKLKRMTLLIVKLFIVSFLLVSALTILSNIAGYYFAHSVKVSLTNSYFTTPVKLFETILKVENYPEWRNGVTGIKYKSSNPKTWDELYGTNNRMQLNGDSFDNNNQFSIVSTSNTAPFQIKRTYRVFKQDYMSFLEINDELIYEKAYLRFFSRLFYDHEKTVRAELKKLDLFLEN